MFWLLSLQTPGLADQLLKIKVQYQCLEKLRVTMESAKYTMKEAVEAIQVDLTTSEKALAASTDTPKK